MNDLLQACWGTTPKHKAIVAIKAGRVKHFYPSSSAVASAVAQQLDQQGHDVYFTPGLFHTNQRSAEKAAGANCFFLDIDCGEGKPYATWKHGLLAFLKWAVGIQFFRPSYIVFTGSGLHVYWHLDEHLDAQPWLAIAHRLKACVAASDLQADLVVTADAARIMRVPGTHNYKYDTPSKSRVLFADDRKLSREEFISKLPAAPALVSAPSVNISREWDVPTDFPPADGGEVATQCKQIGLVREKGGAVSEPFWRAAMSIAERCENKEVYIEQWSKGDPRYNPAEARRKAAQTAGPYTCQAIELTNPMGCVGCPHKGKVTSPIQLSVATPEPDEGDDKLYKVGRFLLNQQGVYYQPPSIEGEAAEKPEPVCTLPLWVDEVRERARFGDDQGDANVKLGWVGLDGTERTGIIRARDLYDLGAMRQWLGDHLIMPAVISEKAMQLYINQYTAARIKRDGIKQYHDTLGWHPTGFVIGDRVVDATGAKPVLVQGDVMLKNMKARGDVATWTQAVNKLAAPEHWRSAFAIMAGFGSPLLDIAGKKSAVVSLVGPSGAGKTLSANLALSIYGNPEYLSSAATSTTKSIINRMELARHVPVLIDEVTSLTHQKLNELIYACANGQGTARLDRNANAKEVRNFALTPYMTSNHPILEFNESQIEEAHRRRIVELTFDKAFDSELGAELDRMMLANHSVAGERYLQLVAGMRDKIPALIDQACSDLTRKYAIPSASRFGLWTLAAAKVGGAIAKAAGLIDFDLDAVLQKVAETFSTQAKRIALDNERVPATVAEWLNDNHKGVVYWKDGDPYLDTGYVSNEPVARVLGNGTIAIASHKLNALLEEQRISKAMSRPWFQEVTAEKPRTVRLQPGIPPVKCRILRTFDLGVDDEPTGEHNETNK